MVGQLPLEQHIGVRIPGGQPITHFSVPPRTSNTLHIVPLSRQSIAVLRALDLLTGNRRLVFPGANDEEMPMSNNTILFALYRLGYKGRMTGHGFRGLASTLLHENEFEAEHMSCNSLTRSVIKWPLPTIMQSI